MPNFHPYAKAVLALSPVHYFRLGESSGAVAVDEAGVQDGAYTGGVTLGEPGLLESPNTAVDFDGIDGRVEVAHHASQLFTTGGAIEAIIVPHTAGGGGLGRIVDKSSGSNGGTGYAFYVWQASASDVRLRGNLAGNSSIVDSASSSITLGERHHVIMSWDAAGLVTFFVNGVQSGLTKQSGLPSGITTTAMLNIGSSPNVANRFFDGVLDEPAIYNQPFTVIEAARHFRLISDFAQVGVMVSGIDRTLLVDGDAGLSWNDQLNGRGQLGLTFTDAPPFQVTEGGVSEGAGAGLMFLFFGGAGPLAPSAIEATGAFQPMDGQEILVFEDSVRRFGGHLYEPDEQLTPDRTLMFYACSAVEFSAIADRFTVVRIYEGETFEDIVTDIVTQDLAGEGISTAGVDGGPVIQRAVFNDVTVTQAFNDLAELVGYAWWIDENRVLQFHARAALQAPAQLTLDTIESGTFRVRHDRERYRNRQILKGGKALTDARSEDSVGDGERRVFATAFPIGAVPTVQVSRNGGAFGTETVGILGVDDTQQWFWNLAASQVSQNDAGTVLAAVDRVRVIYQGQFNLKIDFTDLEEVSSRQALEGGTGIHTHVETRPEVEDLSQGIQTTFALIERFATVGKVITAETREQGLRAGQLIRVNVPQHGVNDDFLIDTITATVPPGLNEIRYQVQARSSDPFGSWQTFFRQLLYARRPFTLEGEDESLTVVRAVAVPVLAVADVVINQAAPENRIGFMTIGRGEIGP